MAYVRDNLVRGNETSSRGSATPSASGSVVIDTGMKNLYSFIAIDLVSGYGVYRIDNKSSAIGSALGQAQITVDSVDNGIVTLSGASLTTDRTFTWSAAE